VLAQHRLLPGFSAFDLYRPRWFRLCAFRAIFIHDRDQNENVGEESDKIKKWLILVWIAAQSQRSAIQSLQEKRHGKKRNNRSPVSFQKRRKNKPTVSEAMAMAPSKKKSIASSLGIPDDAL
jgi:hypothetical protein